MTWWLETGLSNALLATALAVAAWLVTRLCRHPQVAFVIWLLVLVRLLMPPVLGIAWQGWPDLAEETIVEATGETAAEFALPMADGAPPTVAAEAPRAVASARLPASWSWPSAGVLLCAGWLSGSALWLAVAVVRIARFRRTLVRASLAPAALQAEVAALAAEMRVRRVPTVRLVHSPLPPLVWALSRRPTILVPAALLERLSPAERTTLLAHELAHAARRDQLVRLVEMAALVLFWWHPVAWWARRHVERAVEECCDASVVARFPQLAGDYARALLATVDFLSDARPGLPVGTSGFSPVRHLKRRLKMILRGAPARRVRWPMRLALVVLAAVALPPFLHRVAAAPKPFEPQAGTIEERLGRLEKAMQELTAELRAARTERLEDAPPKVIKSAPADGATDVDPNLTEIRVTFNKDMHDGTWSWTQRSDDTFPEITGKPHYIDKRTCVLPVKLQPGKAYHLSINSERFRNFKDEGRRPAIPYPIDFKTK